MPRVSVISIALVENEFEGLYRSLAQQTFQDFEFIGEVGGTIPEAWNRAIRRASGEILVFTETDATPVNKYWLEELVNGVPDERTIVKGLEITGQPWDLANLACYRAVLQDVKFDENFLWAEDSELFCRLKHLGYELQHIPAAPVIHLQKMRSKRRIRRAFRYGLYQAKLCYMYGDREMVSGADLAAKVLVQACLTLLGLIAGYILYWPAWLKRVVRSKVRV